MLAHRLHQTPGIGRVRVERIAFVPHPAVVHVRHRDDGFMPDDKDNRFAICRKIGGQPVVNDFQHIALDSVLCLPVAIFVKDREMRDSMVEGVGRRLA